MQGIIGKKLGMTRIFQSNGEMEGVTVIEAGPCTITQVKTVTKDGYDAVQLGFAPDKRLNSPEKGHLKGLEPYRYLREFRTAGESAEVGQKVEVGLFKAGDRVDVIGISKGKGFAGVVKRHHFKGGPKTHGQSDRQRAPGSIGSTTTPGRVYKGKRMAGHLGNGQVTARNLVVSRVDPARNLLLVKGAVPGSPKRLVMIRKAGKGK